MTDLSIIIVTYNSARFIAKCLDSLLAHPVTRYEARIVVVDNASSDDTVSIVRESYPQVTLIESGGNLGFGRGNNLGMQRAPARYYYLHNADAYLQENVLDAALDHMEAKPRTGIAGLPLVYPDLSPQTAAYGRSAPLKWTLQELGVGKLAGAIASHPRLGPLRAVLRRVPVARSYLASHAPEQSSKIVENPDWVCGAALLLREEVRVALKGGFDPDIFLYGEDEDMCLMARSKGWQIEQLDVTPVIHELGWGTNSKPSPVVARFKADSLRVFIDKHFTRPGPRWMVMRAILWIRCKRWGL
ncbi:glycosyltransferase family 2 protein [Pontivivens nitratireducens]|uniref:Glycosyltransferase family 2 protein n=1 Tax=Pontivivens nitratireducens TaxID=2758038 RepID=A0A6G7VQH9_9RHOB|nr:glycosyltransferase family 2 protein [Pontibrevibacter nitratireducens]QIK42333.1 glycosyltransferase family 2 protein [Pontibrevibacter nitratireducens]